MLEVSGFSSEEVSPPNNSEGGRAVAAQTQFKLMERHGEGVRLPTNGGTVILSRLPRGRSAVHALPTSLKFVLDGEEVYEIDGRSHRVAAGNFLLVEGGRHVKVRTSGSTETIGMCIYFGDNESPDPAAFGLSVGAVAGDCSEYLGSVLSRFACALLQQPVSRRTLAGQAYKDSSTALVGYLAAVHGKVERISAIKHSTRVETLRRLERARSFIHEHDGRHLTLVEIASHAALSRFHLTRSFVEVYGEPPLAYHRKLRLEAAAERLRRGEQSTTRISEELGYGSLSAFTRAFRHRFGVPPSQIRAAA